MTVYFVREVAAEQVPCPCCTGTGSIVGADGARYRCPVACNGRPFTFHTFAVAEGERQGLDVVDLDGVCFRPHHQFTKALEAHELAEHFTKTYGDRGKVAAARVDA